MNALLMIQLEVEMEAGVWILEVISGWVGVPRIGGLVARKPLVTFAVDGSVGCGIDAFAAAFAAGVEAADDVDLLVRVVPGARDAASFGARQVDETAAQRVPASGGAARFPLGPQRREVHGDALRTKREILLSEIPTIAS